MEGIAAHATMRATRYSSRTAGLVFLTAAIGRMPEGDVVTFAGKVALVAGGTGGLGRAVTLAFLQEGADAVVTYRKAEELDALKAAAGGNESRLTGHRVDVTDEAAVEALLGRVVSQHGQLDALVNAVGGYAGGAKLWETETGAFDQMLLLNLRSGYILSRAAVPVMVKQGHGVILNVASPLRCPSWRRRGRLRRLEGCGGGNDRLPGRGLEGHRRSRELGSPEYHRHRSQSDGDAEGRLLEVAEAGGDRPRHSLSLQRRRNADSGRGDPRLR